MATPVKTVGTSVLSLQQIASGAVLISTVQSVTTKFSALFGVHLGRDDTGGVLAQGISFRVEGSMKSSGNDQWFPLAEYTSGTATPADEAVSGTEAAGATVIEVANTTGFVTYGEIIFFKNSTIANSEWARINTFTTNTSITIQEGLTNAQTGSTIYDQAEIWAPVIDLLNTTRVRLVADASGGGRTVVVEAYMTSCDSIG